MLRRRPRPPRALSAFRTIVNGWNSQSDGPQVKLRAWRDGDRMRAAIESGEAPVPDVFMSPRTDLRWLLELLPDVKPRNKLKANNKHRRNYKALLMYWVQIQYGQC